MKDRTDPDIKKHEELEKLFLAHGFSDYKWIDPQKIVVSHWVRMKCMFGCDEYGKTHCCPPHVPPVTECEQFFREYGRAVVFHFSKQVEKAADRFDWSKQVNLSLSKLERAVFLNGYERVFLLFMDSCCICGECTAAGQRCIHPKIARPSPEALAVDVFSTVRQYDFPIAVRSEYAQAMDRYAFLMID
jgi:predicted metal-binding protein